jgi:hypothetical protein
LKDAIDPRQGAPTPDKLVEELEKTDYVGDGGGASQFRDKNDIYPHDPKYGP